MTLDHLIAKTLPPLNANGLAISQFPAVSDLGQPVLEIQYAVDRLVRLAVLERHDGRLVKTTARIDTGDASRTPLPKQMYVPTKF